MMIDIRGWTNFILIPYFYPEGRWFYRQRPFRLLEDCCPKTSPRDV